MKAFKGLQRDIDKTRTKLIARAKAKGIYENFGQKEIMVLKEKWFVNGLDYLEEKNMRNILNEFDNWCAWYNG